MTQQLLTNRGHVLSTATRECGVVRTHAHTHTRTREGEVVKPPQYQQSSDYDDYHLHHHMGTANSKGDSLKSINNKT